MSEEKRIDLEYIRSRSPCYDPARHIGEDWSGDVIEFLKKDIPFIDQLWLVTKDDIVSMDVLRSFSEWCFNRSSKLSNDERTFVLLKGKPKFHVALFSVEGALSVCINWFTGSTEDDDWGITAINCSMSHSIAVVLSECNIDMTDKSLSKRMESIMGTEVWDEETSQHRDKLIELIEESNNKE